MDRIFMLMKRFVLRDCLSPPLLRGYIHIHVYDHNIQTFKNLFLQNQKAYDFETWHEALKS